VTPLPSWLFGSSDLPDSRRGREALDPETEKAIASILSAYPEAKPKAPALLVLAVDRGQAKGGEDYALSLIIQGSLKRADYPAAISQLRNYLSLNRSEDVTARAHFYLGQALAMTGSYRDAFFEFLLARKAYSPESRPWILYLVSMLRP
jgi:TolA-binding protein